MLRPNVFLALTGWTRPEFDPSLPRFIHAEAGLRALPTYVLPH